MTQNLNRRIILESRPQGIPAPEHFGLIEESVPAPGPGQLLVRNRYLSVDPAQRGWVNAVANYSQPVGLGDVMRAFAVGEVVNSNHPDYAVGEIVTGLLGWQDYALSDGVGLRRVDPALGPISTAVGILGINGLSAYFGLLDAGQPKAGETVVVSTAAGAVGSCVGQIAGIRDCRAVGLTGNDDKVARCRDEFGFDAAINYRTTDDLDGALAAACPDGIDVYFDNTGGPILDAVLRRINVGARIVICGTAATANWDPPPTGPRVERHLLVKRARIQGFLIFDYLDRFDEGQAALSKWIREGRINYREDITDGIENAPSVLAGLYQGRNTGKALIRL